MKNLTLFLGCYILASSLVLDVQGFAPVAHRSSVPSALGLAKGGKGFGSTSEPAPKKKQETTVVSSTGSGNSSSPVADTPASRESGPNAGQRALAEMRRQRAEQKDAELRKVREMLQADKQLEETPAAIPERVAQRMGQRMLPFVGLPLLGGMGCFVAFWYLATYKGMEFQPVLVAISTIVILVFSLLGITYSVMSASWDEDREGDFWGIEEFQRNVGNVWEGLDRSRENAVLRDRLRAGDVSVEEALAAEKKKTAPKTLSEKLEQDGFD